MLYIAIVAAVHTGLPLMYVSMAVILLFDSPPVC